MGGLFPGATSLAIQFDLTGSTHWHLLLFILCFDDFTRRRWRRRHTYWTKYLLSSRAESGFCQRWGLKYERCVLHAVVTDLWYNMNKKCESRHKLMTSWFHRRWLFWLRKGKTDGVHQNTMSALEHNIQRYVLVSRKKNLIGFRDQSSRARICVHCLGQRFLNCSCYGNLLFDKENPVAEWIE